MKRVYAVILRLVDTQLNEQAVAMLDEAMSSYGDWFRFNGVTWLLETDTDSPVIQQRLRLLLSDNDSVAILKLDLSDFNGWANPDLWKWLQSKMSLANTLGGLAGLGTSVTLGGLASLSPFTSDSDEKK